MSNDAEETPVTAGGKQLYTIEQAQQIIAVRTCSASGHDFDIVTINSLDPVSVICSRCNRVWRVAS